MYRSWLGQHELVRKMAWLSTMVLNKLKLASSLELHRTELRFLLQLICSRRSSEHHMKVLSYKKRKACKKALKSRKRKACKKLERTKELQGCSLVEMAPEKVN